MLRTSGFCNYKLHLIIYIKYIYLIIKYVLTHGASLNRTDLVLAITGPSFIALKAQAVTNII